MAIVRPFAALRPDPARAAQICELPYDVLSSAEAREQAAGNPLSFFHVSKPEIDLEPNIRPDDERVYAQGRKRFGEMIAQGALRREAKPCYYLYRQIRGQHSQLGLVAVTSCDEYLQNRIRKHELTRPDKEDDRVRHIESLNAQTGPAFLIYPATSGLVVGLQERTQTAPDIDFVAPDSVRHSSWTIADGETQSWIAHEFETIPALYIADGHHRSAAAARIFQKRQGVGSSGYFLSVLFPDNQVKILPYHRVLKDLNGMTSRTVLEKLKAVFTVAQTGRAEPEAAHELGYFLEGKWWSLRFRPELVTSPSALEQLDVTLLQNLVLGPLFGIQNPRTSPRINFVGGIRGTGELEQLVNAGEYACAFSMFPTSVSDLMAIAEAGGMMPPKSTWFEPKLRDGMFSHCLE